MKTTFRTSSTWQGWTNRCHTTGRPWTWSLTLNQVKVLFAFLRYYCPCPSQLWGASCLIKELLFCVCVCVQVCSLTWVQWWLVFVPRIKTECCYCDNWLQNWYIILHFSSDWISHFGYRNLAYHFYSRNLHLCVCVCVWGGGGHAFLSVLNFTSCMYMNLLMLSTS